MARIKWLIPVLIAAAVSGAVARADILHLKNGNQIEGRVLAETETEIRLETPAGIVTIRTADIERIERKISPIEEYEQALATLKDDDSVGHYYLGVWAKRHGLRRQAQTQFRQVISINPNHREAREELNYVMHAGEWVTQDEAMEAKGFVRYKGRWLSAAEAQSLLRQDKIAEETSRLRRHARQLDGPRKAEGQKLFAEFGPKAANPFEETVAVPVLRNLAGDESAAVRREVIELLAQWRSPQAFDALIEMLLNESDREIALTAVVKLKDINSLRAARKLSNVSRNFRKMIPESEDAQKRALVRRIETVSWALGIVGEPFAVPELADSLRLEVNYVQRTTGVRSLDGPLSSTVEHGNTVSTITTSGVSISSGTRDQIIRFVLNEHAAEAFRRITGERSDFDRMKMLEWWARNKPVLPPEEHEFEL